MKGLSLRAVALLAAAAVPWFAAAASIATASADDYTGQTYSDAASKVSESGKKAVVESRSGDLLPQDDCVVTHSHQAPWLKGDRFTPVTDTVLLDLNCNAKVATAKEPGNSAASPEGREAIKEANKKKP